MKLICFNIDWDTDESVELPEEVLLNIPDEDIEGALDLESTYLADKLSDIHGWCVNSLECYNIDEMERQLKGRVP